MTYHHVMLEAHEVVFANGAETETFHPGNGALAGLEPRDLDFLLASFTELAEDPMEYGGYARRLLEPSEVALLRHEAA